MANFLSQLFTEIAKVPDAIGGFLYDAGIPDPMATAYGDKLEKNMKAQYYKLGQQKLAEEYRKLKQANDIQAKLFGNRLNQYDYDTYEGTVTDPRFSQQQSQDYWNKDSRNKQMFNTLSQSPTPYGKTDFVKDFAVNPSISNLFTRDAGDIASGVMNGYKPKNWTDTTYTLPGVKVTSNITVPGSKGYDYKDISSYLSPGEDADFSGVEGNTAKAGSVLLDSLKGNGMNVGISSAYRDPERNARAGGVSTSNHLSGKAFDLVFDNPEDMNKAAEAAKQQGWSEVLNEGNHLHVGNYGGTLPEGTANKVTTETKTTPESKFNISTPTFNNMFANKLPDGVNKYDYKHAMPREEQIAKYRDLFALGGLNANEIKLGMLTPDQAKRAATNDAGITMTENQTQTLKQKALDDFMKLNGDWFFKGKEHGTTANEAQAMNSNLATYLTNFGIDPSPYKVVINPTTGRLQIETALHQAKTESDILRNNVTMNQNERKLGIYAANVQDQMNKRAIEAQKLLKEIRDSNKIDPTKQSQADRLLTNGNSDGYVDLIEKETDPIKKQRLYDVHKAAIYELSQLAGNTPVIEERLINAGVMYRSKHRD